VCWVSTQPPLLEALLGLIPTRGRVLNKDGYRKLVHSRVPGTRGNQCAHAWSMIAVCSERKMLRTQVYNESLLQHPALCFTHTILKIRWGTGRRATRSERRNLEFKCDLNVSHRPQFCPNRTETGSASINYCLTLCAYLDVLCFAG
jgi:hypothetical protein